MRFPPDSRLRGNDSPFLAVTPAKVAVTRSDGEGCRGPGDVRRQGYPPRTRIACEGTPASPTNALCGESPGFPHPSASLRASSTCAGMTTISRASPLHKSRTPGAKQWCADVHALRSAVASAHFATLEAMVCRREATCGARGDPLRNRVACKGTPTPPSSRAMRRQDRISGHSSATEPYVSSP